MIYNETLDEIPLNDYKKVWGSCTLYTVLFAVFFITSICISATFVHFYWHSKKDNVKVKFTPTQTTIYYTYK